ncbi:MAG: hypothetical protein ACRCX2_37960 [Paraclostridium sp.]
MITLQEATEYFEKERLFSDKWLSATTQVQNQSLKMAENQINLLKFSSYSDANKDARFKKAICEQALFLFENSQRQKLINQGVTSFSVEGLSESYEAKANKQICIEAMEFLKPYLIGSVSIC